MRDSFLNSFRNMEMVTYTISVTGTVYMMLSGTYAGTYTLKADPDNLGTVYIHDREDAAGVYPFGRSETSGWVPVPRVGLYYHGTVANDKLYIWLLK